MAKKKDPELEVLTRYAERQLTRKRAAKLLDMSERQVTRKMQELGLERIVSERKLRQERTLELREIRFKAARLVVSSKITPKQAAARAGCNERTIYRYVAKVKAEGGKRGKK